jgi:hypothetical protein
VVAGTNYRYNYNVTTPQGWQNWTIVVNENLSGQKVISSKDIKDANGK